MSDIYGDLTYSKGRSKYFGLPVEQEEKTLNALQEKFDTNEAKWDELRTSILDSDFLDTEQETIDSELKNAHDKMGSIIETNNFHLAKSSVRKAVDGFTRSENVKVAKEKKARKTAYDEKMKELVKKYKPGEHGGITEEDYNYAMKMWESLNAGYTHVKDGEIQNKVQSFDVVEQVDFKKYFLDIAENLKASSFDENAQIVVNGEPTTVKKAFGSIGDFYQSFEAKGVDDARNLAVMESIMKEHPVMQRLRYETERDINNIYGVRKDGLFIIGRDGKPVTNITIDDIPSNYVDGTTVYFAKPKRNKSGVPIVKVEDGKQQLEYELHKEVDLSDLDEEEQGIVLREAMKYHYLASREQELGNFATAFSYKEVETEYKENWRARERFRKKLEEEVPIVQTNTTAGTTVATQKYGYNLKTNTNSLLRTIQEFKDNGGTLQNIEELASQNSTQGNRARAILRCRGVILDINKQIRQGLMNITQADLEEQYPSFKSNPAELKKVMQQITNSRDILTKYTSNNDLPIAPIIIKNGEWAISPEWRAYEVANNITKKETHEIFDLYGVEGGDRQDFVKASNFVSQNKGYLETPDREVQAYGGRSSATGHGDMDKALETATNTHFANGQNKVTILQSDNQDATTGTITTMNQVNNLIYEAARKNGIAIDAFRVLKVENLKNGELFTTDKGKVTIRGGNLISKNGVPYSTKIIEVTTADGNIVESITVGATVGTDRKSDIYNPTFGEVAKQAKRDEIAGAMQTGRDIYQVVNGGTKPIVINRGGQKYYIENKTSSNQHEDDFQYYHNGNKVVAKKVPIEHDYGVTKMLMDEVEKNPNIRLHITHGE